MTNFPAVELKGLTKRFGTLVANSEVSLRVTRGTVHAIVGENGAGKSTAMKMLYGLYRPDAGEIWIEGKLWGKKGSKWRSPAEAIASGIGMVHQHFMLAGPYTALENIVIGAETAKFPWGWLPEAFRPIDFAGARSKLDSLSRRYGLEVKWDQPIEDMAVGGQQRIEILKLLYRDAKVLILDEPTAVLTPQEILDLFRQLRMLAAEGKTVLIITHKLREVMALADEVTVFRAGKVVGGVLVKNTDPAQLADMMVGRKVALQVEAPSQPKLGERVLEVKSLSLSLSVAEKFGHREAVHRLSDVSFEVRAGEIVGIAGIEGNGQSELLQVLQHPGVYRSGLRGEVQIFGQKIIGGAQKWNSARIKALGVGVVPEDRLREGLLLERPVRENFLLGLQRRPKFNRRGFISQKTLDSEVAVAFENYDVRPRDPLAIAGRLSGGNQQKLIIAREFERVPRLLLAAQPTRGVDVGAIEFIHKRIFRARAEGAGVLLVSSELDEIFTLADRILVFYSGKIVASFKRGEASEQMLGLAMGGAQSLGSPS
ncbi:ABC transporter ATP-binding protein [Bdellovibrionota bacterium FG-1]